MSFSHLLYHIVRSNNLNKQAFTFRELFNKSVYSHLTPQGRQSIIPFLNRQFRVQSRVVDFYPHNVVDFAYGRSESEYDILSDHSRDEDTEPEENINQSNGFGPSKKWEWRFSLLLEDGNCDFNRSDQNSRQWVLVDNLSAQMLLDMDAAK